MSASPIYAGVIRHECADVSAANTNRDGTGTIVDIFSAGASGSKIEEIVVKATGDPADSTVVIYIYDGSGYDVYDEWDIGNPAAGAAASVSYREARTFDNLFLKANEKLAASITVALTSGVLKVHASGGDF